LSATAVLFAGSCYSTGDGPDPSAALLYFPVGMAVSPGGSALYIANSDFDLQFNSGTVIALDLVQLRSYLAPLYAPDPANPVADPCLGLGRNPNPALQPGDCGPLDLTKPPAAAGTLLKNTVKIGAFATDLVFVCQPTDGPGPQMGAAYESGFGRSRCMGQAADPNGARLFAPVRGDPSLTFFDVDDDRAGQAETFKMECGQGSNNGRCANDHRAGIDSNENTRGLTLPAEPFGIAVSDRADSILITHQAGGAVSLFTSGSSGGATVVDGKPTLQFVYGGVPPATGIVALPVAAGVLQDLAAENDARARQNPPLPPFTLPDWIHAINYQQGFAVAYRGVAEVDVFRFFDDAASNPLRPFLARSSARTFDVVPSGQDSRDVLVEDSERTACRTDCQSRTGQAGFDLASCNKGCDEIPLGAFLTNRAPPSLLIGQVVPAVSSNADESIVFYDAEPLPNGPSRVVAGQIRDRSGVNRPRIFTICFDSREIVVYDPIEHRVDGQIRTGRGPQALVMDPVAPLAYVAHFTDSYVGLIDLDQAHDATFESIVATIGIPTAPQESN
jgi:DNA-binding beta-propeller fold protein YncE